jgi:hypothetical protein
MVMEHVFFVALVAWLVADFLSGFWHWLEDRYFDTRWPLIGKYIAKPNQLHHDQPSAFLNQGYWKRNWTTILPASLAAVIAWFCGVRTWEGLLPFAFVSQANEIHAWAHQRCHPLIRALQEIGALQSPKHHGLHHRAPFETKYCVMSDWLNPILDILGFWRALEWFLRFFFKLQVRQ